MTTFCFQPAKMKALIFACQFFLIMRTAAQIGLPEQCVGSETNRPPKNSDISVLCGTQFMVLKIFLCPIYNATYSETMMILNDQTIDQCKGTADFTAVPPVLTYTLSIDENSLEACNNVFKTVKTDGAGTLDFKDFSEIEYVNVSGLITLADPTTGIVTYRPAMTYIYSCQYPLQYLLNNTEMAVAGVSLVINDNNGSFISTISMRLFSDADYNNLLVIPTTGLQLKQTIYVEVTATDLTNKFNVLLDQCFATKHKYQHQSQKFDLFVGCDNDNNTNMLTNGREQYARFSFEAFRFVQDKNLTVSTFYIHCITRLCNTSMCSSMSQCVTPQDQVQRRRRDTEEENSATVTSPAILVGQQSTGTSEGRVESAKSTEDHYSSPVVAVIVCVAILSFLLLVMAAYFTWHVRQKMRL